MKKVHGLKCGTKNNTIAGALTLSEATTGVGLLCGACLLGILARLAQASTHHRQLLRALEQRDTTVV